MFKEAEEPLTQTMVKGFSWLVFGIPQLPTYFGLGRIRTNTAALS